jgi:hypothetical protein
MRFASRLSIESAIGGSRGTVGGRTLEKRRAVRKRRALEFTRRQCVASVGGRGGCFAPAHTPGPVWRLRGS